MPVRESADRVAALLSAVANPVRIRILQYLETGPKRSSEIAKSVGVSQAALAHHIRKLESQNLLARRGELYEVTPLGRSVLSRIADIGAAASSDLRVITVRGISLPLGGYVEMMMDSLALSKTSGCNRRKLANVVIQELLAAVQASDNVNQLVVDSFVVSVLARSGCLSDTAPPLGGYADRGVLTPQAVEILTRSGLIDFVYSNSLLLDVNWQSGVSSIMLPNTDPGIVREVLRRAEFFPEVVVRLDSDLDNIAKTLELLSVGSERAFVTYVLDLSSGGDFSEKVLELLEVYASHRTPVVLLGWEESPPALHVARLVNSGVPVVFSSKGSFPSGLLYAFAAADTTVVHLGAVSTFMPFVFGGKAPVGDPVDFLKDVMSAAEDVALYLKKLSLAPVKVLELAGATDAAYIFQVALVGFEAGLLLHNPAVRERTSDFESYKRLITRNVIDIFSMGLAAESYEDVKVIGTFYSPSRYLNMLLGLHFKGGAHLHANQLSPFSLNRSIRDSQQLVELEASIQEVFAAPPSVLEIRTRSVNAAELKEFAEFASRRSISQFTLTLAGLGVCNTCSTAVPPRVSRCPKCYSRDVARLAKPGLAYVPKEKLDPWALEEVEARVLYKR